MQAKQPFYFRASMVLLMLLLICIILYLGADIIVPFAFAVLLAILLIPMNEYLEKRGFNRVNAIAVCMLVSFIIIGGIIYFIGTQILAFVDDIPLMRQRTNELIFMVQKWLQSKVGISITEQSTYMKEATGNSSIIGSTFLSLKDSVILLTLLPIYTFLVLYYRDMLKKFLIDIFKDGHREKVQEVLLESRNVIQNYMVGLMIETGIVALINFLGFAIIGIPYAVFLAVLAALLNLIPYIGMLIASVFCALVTLTTSPQTTDAVWVLVVLWVVQFIDNNILMPRIVGSKVKINALITILAVFIGGALCGLSGTFLAIPGVAILKAIFERVDELKPWGMLMSDNITSNKPGRIYSRITSIRKRPTKPPQINVENNSQPPPAL